MVSYRNAKVAIIGNKTTGKVSLKRALLGEPFIAGEVRAEKRQPRQLDRQEKWHTDGQGEVREMLICDMERLSDYRLIHQLYLHEVAVVLITLNVDSDGTLETGLSECVRTVLAMRSRCSLAFKVFLVITCKDRIENESRFFTRRAEELMRQLSFDRWFQTSAKQRWGIDELRLAIFEAIDWEKQPQVCSLPLLQEIERFLSKKKEEGWQLFPLDDLYKVFETLWVTMNTRDEDPQGQFEACLKCIEAKGGIHWLNADRYILLQPTLIDSYIARLLYEARDDPEGLGYIDEINARRGLFSPAEGRLKDRAFERIVLGSIVDDFLDYSIALRGYHDGLIQRPGLIFPSQADQENHPLTDPEKEYYIFRFQGEIATIYLTLKVRLARSNIFSKEFSGLNSVTYIVEAGKRCRLFLKEHGKTQASLTLCFDDGVSENTRKLFAAFVFVHLASYDRNTEGRAFLRCPNCNTLIDESQEKALREREKYTFRCMVCDREMRLPGGEIFPTSPDMREQDSSVEKTRLAEEVKKRKQQERYDAFLCCNEEQQDKREALRICDELKKRGITVWFEDKDMPPGVPVLREIVKQIEQCPAAVICFGLNGDTEWLKIYLETLLNQRMRREYRLVLVSLEHAPRERPALSIPYETRWVDFHERDPDPIEQLIWGIKGERP